MRGAPRRLLLLLLCAAACALKPIQRRRLLATSALLPASQAAALAPKPSPPPPPSYVREDVAGSPGDLRAYRLLRFASGLRVLLASDASARDATVAATAVAASFDGNANAYTAFDCTTYVASCFPSRVGRLLAAYGDALSPRTADRFDGATAPRARSATARRRRREARDPLPALERGSNVVVASGRDVLSLTWSVPYESLGGADAYRRAKPCATVSHVLGHGGPGSLQAKLRAMAPTSGSRPGQPALSAGAFLENDDASGFALFHVRVFLQRSAQWEEALTHALGAVAALRLTPLPLWKDAADDSTRTVRTKVRRSALTRARRVRYFDVDVDVAAVGPAPWWRFPRRRPTCRAAAGQVDPAPSPFAVDSAAASPVSIDFLLEMAAKRQPQAGAAVERRGAGAGWRRSGSTAPTKPGAAPRAKLLRVDVALAEPLYDAALAGCKYEFAFLRAAPNAPGPAAGARVALAAYADVLPRFALDYARRLGELAASPIPAADLARAKAFALLEPGLGENEKRALADATEADVRAEAAALWNSAARAAPAFGEALVAAEDADEASAKKLVAAVYRELLPAYVPLATARAPAAPPADRPSRLLASRNSWDHPVAANACVASGVPGLLANCNVR
ncbi:M16 peptidase-like protein [Aureococcus anophagefferens]|nr:M16 peptidase-like protein [Aureococcus anophagefferens]